LVDKNHILQTAIEPDGLLKCEFLVPEFAKGTFYIKLQKPSGNLTGNQIFLKKNMESAIEYISFSELLKDQPTMHNNPRH